MCASNKLPVHCRKTFKRSGRKPGFSRAGRSRKLPSTDWLAGAILNGERSGENDKKCFSPSVRLNVVGKIAF